MARIRFFSEGISFKLSKPRITSQWIELAAKKEKATINSVNYVFCSDGYLLEINKQYLNHSTFTDIITFDYGDRYSLEGEIYISIDRVNENAKKFGASFEVELRRVMIHGVLHLLGYKDKKPAEKSRMRKKEEAYLSLLK